MHEALHTNIKFPPAPNIKYALYVRDLPQWGGRQSDYEGLGLGRFWIKPRIRTIVQTNMKGLLVDYCPKKRAIWAARLVCKRVAVTSET